MIEDLTPGQLIFVRSRLSGKTITKSAEDAGVSERTGSTWTNDPEIHAELCALKAEAVTELKAFAQSLKRPALQMLDEIRGDRHESTTARINASKAILSAISELELAEHREKLTELETILKLEAM